MLQTKETLIELTGVPNETLMAWVEAGLECEHWNGRVLTSRRALERFHWHQADEFGPNCPQPHSLSASQEC
jgi:hypothetical protein